MELFGIRTKLAYNEIIFRKLITYKNEKKKMQIFINKLVYLGLTILEISKIMYELFYDCVKPRYQEK